MKKNPTKKPTKKTYKPRTEAQKIARRERDRARAAAKRAAKANAPAPVKKATAKKVAKKMTPEERLLKAIGVEAPRFCDTELAFSNIVRPFRLALRAQAKKVADECRNIIDAVARLMREFDSTVFGVSITNVTDVPENVLRAEKKAAKKATKAKKAAKK